MTSSLPLRVGLLGCTGRMGQMLLQLIHASDHFVLKGAITSSQNRFLGQDVGRLLPAIASLNVSITDGIDQFANGTDVLIDFSSPQALETHLNKAQAYHLPIVIGTTGLDQKHHDLLSGAAKTIPIVQAANMSLAVNLLLMLTEQAARILGKDYDIEIIEAHHRHKKDAPSGTALSLGNVAARGRGIDPANKVMARQGMIGERPDNAIGFAVVRGGAIPGDHTVLFAGDHDQICLSHQAYDRSIFAQGALKAASWLKGKQPGLYSMQDVLATLLPT